MIRLWGAIFHDLKLPLVRIDGRLNGQLYVVNILAQHVIRYTKYERAHGKVLTLQQNRAPPQHRSIWNKTMWTSLIGLQFPLTWAASRIWCQWLVGPSRSTHTRHKTTSYGKSYLQLGTWYLMMLSSMRRRVGQLSYLQGGLTKYWHVRYPFLLLSLSMSISFYYCVMG